ncbi:MAG: TonB-dependent receptor plug domain-containing protein [Ferruginibacter sp.]
MKKIKYLLFFLLMSGSAVMAQKKTITGKVTSQDGKAAMEGVNVLADKQKTGAVTKADGTYSISVDKKTTVLIFSYVGYKTQNVIIGDKTTVDVVLAPAIATSDEVVVIGYGTQKKSSVTGAVSKYKNDKMDESPVSRLDQALQGKIAGVQVTNISSEAGSDPKVQVRGLSSISAGQSPLVVVDGHPVPDGLAFVNMSDVESVEVLKDAASAAIYGSRGGSGVILITTKSGKSEKAKYNLKTSWGTKNPYKVYDIMTTSEYTNLLYYEASLRFADTGWTNYATTAQIMQKVIWHQAQKKHLMCWKMVLNGGVATDWQAAALRDCTN